MKSDVGYLRQEYQDLGVEAQWLSSEKAKNAYGFVEPSCREDYYALDPARVDEFEEHVIESMTVATAWLSNKMPSDGTVQVIYGDRDVAVIGSADFLEHWQEILCPGRVDASGLHNLSKDIFFYCYEDEWTYGRRR